MGCLKKQLKKQIKLAKRNYRKNEDPYHAFSGTTGKHWAKVRDEHKKAIDNDEMSKELKRKRNVAYAKAEHYDFKGEIDKSEFYQERGDMYDIEYRERSAEIGKKYTRKYEEALLKDINYSDIEKGRRMLAEYGVDNKWGKIV